jgi:uncharacterized membrane protein YdjX (TVP38/TMEM64 family)
MLRRPNSIAAGMQESASASNATKATVPAPPRSVLSDVGRVLLLAGFLIVSTWLLTLTPWSRGATFEKVARFQQWLAQWGAWAWLVYVAAGIGLVSIGFPRIVLSAVGGAMFGVFLGTMWSQLSMTLAILAPFLYSRHLGRELVARRMGRRLQRFDDLLGQHGFMVVLLIRLCPVGNNFLTNYLAGVTAIPLGTFLAASFVGYLPESFIFALLGSGLADHPQLRLWGGAVLLALFSLFFIWYFRRSKEGTKILAAMRTE